MNSLHAVIKVYVNFINVTKLFLIARSCFSVGRQCPLRKYLLQWIRLSLCVQVSFQNTGRNRIMRCGYEQWEVPATVTWCPELFCSFSRKASFTCLHALFLPFLVFFSLLKALCLFQPNRSSWSKYFHCSSSFAVKQTIRKRKLPATSHVCVLKTKLFF